MIILFYRSIIKYKSPIIFNEIKYIFISQINKIDFDCFIYKYSSYCIRFNVLLFFKKLNLPEYGQKFIFSFFSLPFFHPFKKLLYIEIFYNNNLKNFENSNNGQFLR